MHKLVYLLTLILLSSCATYIKNKEARDDKKQFDKSISLQKAFEHKIKVDVETAPVSTADPNDDAADDPAFWVNPNNPENSLVIGSNKKKGIHSYDLKGNEMQFIPCGKINNVDVRQNFTLSDNSIIDIVAGSNRTDRSIDLFYMNKDGKINSAPFLSINVAMKPYGFCLGERNDKILAFVNDKNGKVAGFEISPKNNTFKQIMTVNLSSQVEGMVYDDESQLLYIGEEQRGIFIYDMSKGTPQLKLIASSTRRKNKDIHYDIEGLSIFKKADKKYLLASIQGSFSYAIFDIETMEYLKSFTLEANNSIDAVEETDGLETSNFSIPGLFPEGILIVQDGFNNKGETIENQNFKIIDLSKVLKLID